MEEGRYSVPGGEAGGIAIGVPCPAPFYAYHIVSVVVGVGMFFLIRKTLPRRSA